MFDLRRFLSRSPIPDKLKITNHNGEEQIIQLPPGRKRWANVEETVRTSRAQDLQLLNDRGEVIRAKRLSEEEIEGEDDVEASGKHDEKIIQRALSAQAQMLDRYGARMNDAFERGAAAASTSQDKLVDLVEVLTQHLTLAINNLHTMGVNYANATSGQGDGGEPNTIQAIIGMLAASKGMVVQPPPEPNGKAKKP